VNELSPAAVWPISAALVISLDDHLGPPIDSYLNGTQTWLTPIEQPSESEDLVLEWRLHPVAKFSLPTGIRHDDLWEAVIVRLNQNDEELIIGKESRVLTSLWDGLECFPAYGEDLEPAALSLIAIDLLKIAPSALGLVDHQRIGSRWEHAQGRESITRMLLDELQPTTAPPA
jgi:hypothetical protein